jgi:hypothetical protein
MPELRRQGLLVAGLRELLFAMIPMVERSGERRLAVYPELMK